MQVTVNFGHYAGTTGELEDSIPFSPWYNLRVSPKLRLALKPTEFDAPGLDKTRLAKCDRCGLPNPDSTWSPHCDPCRTKNARGHRADTR